MILRVALDDAPRVGFVTAAERPFRSSRGRRGHAVEVRYRSFSSGKTPGRPISVLISLSSD
jgi:hypothetical protein